MDIKILGSDRRAALIRDGALILEEARSYRLYAPAALEARLDALQLDRSDDGYFEISTDHEVGSYKLRLIARDSETTRTIRVQPRTSKLSPALWSELLEELEGWLTGVSVGVCGARMGAVGTRGVAAPFLAEALVPLLPALHRALQDLLASPREHHQIEQRERRLHECRRVAPSTLAWISRHHKIIPWLDGWRACDAISGPPTLPISTAIITLDHPVNRYIVWLIRRVVSQLRAVSTALANHTSRSGQQAWCIPRAQTTASAATRLQALLNKSRIAGICPAPASEAAFMVLANDPSYARFHRLARRFVSPRFRLQNTSDTPGAAVRPSYSIYEIWCFFALRRALEDALPNWQWHDSNHLSILDISGTGEKALSVASQPGNDARLTLEFNPTFPSLYAALNHPKTRFSLSGQRRPDFVLTLDGHGSSRFVILDAKYRAGRANLQEAMESLHIYRDCLIDRNSRPRAALILAPRKCDDVAMWSDPAWQTRWGIGLSPFAPRSDHTLISRWILQNLGLQYPH